MSARFLIRSSNEKIDYFLTSSLKTSLLRNQQRTETSTLTAVRAVNKANEYNRTSANEIF